ncbi:UNVERIFIED_CONTAM: hypothetical protein GTU68_016712 [Idotea baltica]|nr:hypothetical protein [Idotea baltica]
MVVTAHPEASKITYQILKKGGNAIDAAVAVQMALTVVYPIAGNIGGGGFMVYRTNEGQVECLDFRERAPLLASRDMYLDDQQAAIDGLSIDGALAVGVPGTVDGCVVMHEKYGRLKWEQLIQPAIDLARNGFRVTKKQSEKLNEYMAQLRVQNANVVCPHLKGAWQSGDILKQEDLAKSLERIKIDKRAGFYEGETAKLLIASMEANGGVINQSDLDNYKSVWREPVVFDYNDYRIYSMSPPSSGGLLMAQMLKMLSAYPIEKWKFQDFNSVHHIVEAERRAYADRSVYLGDPDFVSIPMAELLSDKYIAQRVKSIDSKKASDSQNIKAGSFEIDESEETTHFSIVDQWGNAVSITTTLNGAYGSKLMVDGAGFFLNNEMDDFSIKPGVPNQYGLVGAEANAIEPGKRMLSSMTPTIVEKGNKLYMVLGTPGGSTIITSVMQCFLNVVNYGMTMQESVNAKRFHHQYLPDQIYYEEDTFSKEMLAALKTAGHSIKQRKPIGKVDAILVLPDGRLEGAGDIRGDDTALGF